jgi:hypothetical protein
MISRQQVEKAKEAMDQAQAALRAYNERPQWEPPNPVLHVKLADELRESIRVYQDLFADFSKQQSS